MKDNYAQGYSDGHDDGYSLGVLHSDGHIALWTYGVAFAFGLIIGCLL